MSKKKKEHKLLKDEKSHTVVKWSKGKTFSTANSQDSCNQQMKIQ